MSSPKATRRAARQAARSFIEYKDSSDESDNASQGSEFGESKRKYTSGQKQGKRTQPRKRKASISSKLSDLTPLTSPEPSQSQHTTADKEVGQSSAEKNVDWRWVWVRVDCEGRLVKDYAHESFWWPAKVQSVSINAKPLNVTFFNGLSDVPPPLDNLNASMLLSFFGVSRKRRFASFSEAAVSPRVDNVQLSNKKVKRDSADMIQLWTDAVVALERDAGITPSPKHPAAATSRKPDIDLTLESSSDDDLPDVRVAHSKSFNPNSLFRRRHHSFSGETRDDYTSMGSLYTTTTEAMDDPDISEQDTPDPNITIPGEGVLARTSRRANEYWPARITEFLSGTKNRRARYRVEWFDSTPPQLLPRSHFYLQEEEGFHTCPLGVMKGGKQAKDSTADENDDDVELQNRASPAPILPPPPAEEFAKQDTRSQLQYLKPVLVAIMTNNYPPARPRHNDFLAGGKKRLAVTKRAYNKGNLSVPEYHQLERCLRWWCLRDQNECRSHEDNDLMNYDTDDLRTERATPDSTSELPTDDLSSKVTDDLSMSQTGNNVQRIPMEGIISHNLIPARPHGCEEYEVLLPMEKIEYCMNVLLPEAVIQLLLWQCGERRTLDLQTEEVEDHLWNIGNRLSEQEDWVWKILNNRHQRQPKPPAPVERAESFSNTGRPRRATRT